MTRAYILIETNGGQAYKYVRDVIADSNGVAEKFYRYEGNGYQELNISIPGELRFTPLVFDTLYSIKVNVDAAGAEEYTFTFPAPSNEIGILNLRHGSVTYAQLIEKLEQISKTDFTVKLINEDLRFISNGSSGSTSIAITAGTSGTDLLTTLSSTPSAAVTSDNFINQTGAGKVSGDYDTIVTSWTGSTYPEITTFTVQFDTNPDDIGGKYFTINSSTVSYYVWYDVSDTDSDPTPGGTGIEVDIVIGDSVNDVAAKTATAIAAAGESILFGTSNSGADFTVTNIVPGTSVDGTIGTLNGAPALFVISVDQQGVGTDGLLEFPESAGSTSILKRKNYLNGSDDISNIIIQIFKSNVTTIKVIEEVEEGAIYIP